MVLLSLLDMDVFVVDECRGVDHGCRVGHFLLVDAHAALLDHLASLSFAGEHCGLDGKQLEQGNASLKFCLADLEAGHAVEYVEKRLLVETAEGIGGIVAEEYRRSLDGSLVILLAVDHDGDFFCKTLLKLTGSGVLVVCRNECLDLLFGKGGEDLDVFLGVGVGYVEPELIELVRRGIAGVEPYVSALGLAEFAAVSLGDEGAGEREDLAAVLAADKLGAGGDVAPLVGTAELELAVLCLVKGKEVEALEKLVCELGEAQSVAGLAVKSLLHAVFSHHVVHRDMLAYLAGEIKESDVLGPVVVVHEFRAVGGVALEIKELGELFLYAFLIVTQGGLVEEVALGRFSGGVADHACRAADECQGLVSATLEMTEHHHSAEMAYVKGVSRRVYAEVSCCHLFLELFVSAGHHGVHHAAPRKFFNKIHMMK